MRIVDELTKLKQPYIHLAVVDKSDFQGLYSTYEDSGNGNVVIRFIEGSKCTTLDDFFREFAKALEFPDYFGYNWAAFDECLNDLDWLQGDAYLLLLDDVDKVMTTPENSFKILIETLTRSVSEWTEGRNYDGFPTSPIPFHVVFQCSKEKESEVKAKFETGGLRDINILNITSVALN